MKYTNTIFYVENVLETVEFYEKAFGFSRQFVTPENDYGELITGETAIGFISLELANSNLSKGFQQSTPAGKPFGAELAFTSEDWVADFQKALDAGATEVEPLTDKPWGQTIGYLRDNNGFLIEIASPMPEE